MPNFRLQKHINGTSDSALKSALVPKELGFNETLNHGLYKHEDNITFATLPSEEKLGLDSGAAIIGVDDSSMTVISGDDVQEALLSTDSEFDGIDSSLSAINATLLTLTPRSEVLATSTTYLLNNTGFSQYETVETIEYKDGTGYGGAKWKNNGTSGTPGAVDFINGLINDANGTQRKIILQNNTLDIRSFGIDDTTADAIEVLDQAYIFMQKTGGSIFCPDDIILNISRRFILKGGVSLKGHFKFNFTGNVASPENRILDVASNIDVTFGLTGTITSGQTIFPAVDGSNFEIGEFVQLMIGEDPFDSNEEKYRYFAQVTNNGIATLTVNVGCPRDTPTNFQSRIIKFKTLNNGIEICDITMTKDPFAGIIDLGVVVENSINISFGNISADIGNYAAVEIRESENIDIKNIYRPIGIGAIGSGGRCLAGWGSKSVKVESVKGATDKALIFVESGNDCEIDRVEGHFTGTVNTNLIHNVGRANLKIRKVFLSNTTSDMQLIRVDQEATSSIEEIEIASVQKSALLKGVKIFRDGIADEDFLESISLTKSIPLSDSLAPLVIELGNGIISNLSAMITSSLVNISNVYIGEDGGVNVSILADIVAADDYYDIDQFSRFGTNYSANVNGVKQAIIYTGIGVDANASLELSYTLLKQSV